MHGAPHIFVPINIGGMDLSITLPVMFMFMASLLLLMYLAWSARRPALVPVRASQTILEWVVDFIEVEVVEPSGLSRGWTPFILTLFLFILFNDLAGVLPGGMAATSNINLTGSLAVLVFLVSIVLRFKAKGFVGFFGSYIPPGVPWWVLFLFVPIELISQVMKPFSLAVRLFANMTAGHLLLLTIAGFTVLYKSAIITAISVGGTIAILLFELFVDFIQAYVFAFLSALMLGEALAEEH